MSSLTGHILHKSPCAQHGLGIIQNIKKNNMNQNRNEGCVIWCEWKRVINNVAKSMCRILKMERREITI